MLFPLFLLLLLATSANAQPPPPTDDSSSSTISFRPSIGIIVGIFSIMFSLTFLLLMYAKFCHNAASRSSGRVFVHHGSSSTTADNNNLISRASSGIDKSVIDSLPFFRFSSLCGDRAGLECSVCISKFSDSELLRLLPKCKHAFHADCIDKWLSSHSTCPLCRHRIAAGDAAAISESSARFLFCEDNNDGLVVERVGGSSREHKIVVGPRGCGLRGRWSDLNSADLVWLDAEMMRSGGGGGGGGGGEEGLLTRGEKRCMSEMTSVRRRGEEEEEMEVRRVWKPIAERTLQWFVRRDQRRVLDEDDGKKLDFIV